MACSLGWFLVSTHGPPSTPFLQVLLFMLNKSQKQAAAKPAPAVAAAAPPNGKGGASGKGPKHSGAPGSRRGSAARPLVQLDKAAAELDPTAPGWHDQALR